MAIAAGCDGVLICAASRHEQMAALEALIHAVEKGRLPRARSRTRWRGSSARRSGSSRRRVRAAAGGAALARGARPRRASGDRRRDGAVRVAMLKPRALRAGDRLAVVAPASPFARDEFDAGVDELRRLGFEPVYDESASSRGSATSPGRRGARGRDSSSAWADPSIARADRRARRLRQRAAAAAARSAEMRRTPQGVHRLQRQHVAPRRG